MLNPDLTRRWKRLLRAMGARRPRAQTTISSTPRLYIGYISSQWHTRQPQPPQQLAAISWCRSHDYRTTERAVRRGSRTDPKKCPVGACENRVLCGGKYAVGVDRGISDSPRQLVNQLQRATACSSTHSCSICSSAAAVRRHGHAGPCCFSASIACSAAVNALCEWIWAYQTAPGS